MSGLSFHLKDKKLHFSVTFLQRSDQSDPHGYKTLTLTLSLSFALIKKCYFSYSELIMKHFCFSNADSAELNRILHLLTDNIFSPNTKIKVNSINEKDV